MKLSDLPAVNKLAEKRREVIDFIGKVDNGWHYEWSVAGQRVTKFLDGEKLTALIKAEAAARLAEIEGELFELGVVVSA